MHLERLVEGRIQEETIINEGNGAKKRGNIKIIKRINVGREVRKTMLVLRDEQGWGDNLIFQTFIVLPPNQIDPVGVNR